MLSYEKIQFLVRIALMGLAIKYANKAIS